jgi:hypothetical protein
VCAESHWHTFDLTIMETNQVLASTRLTHILIARPTHAGKYWATQLPGLSWDHIAQATRALRTKHASTSTKLRDDRSLKTSDLHKSFAKALGVSDQQTLRKLLNDDLPLFMEKHGLITPADLIKPTNQRISMIQFDPREVADRIFNSTNPLPRRIYTGVGGKLFQYAPVHSLFIEFLRSSILGDIGQHPSSQLIQVLQRRGGERVFDENGLEHAHEFYQGLPNGKETQISNEAFLQLTWRDVLLSGGPLNLDVGTMLGALATRHRLLCAGVIGPLQEEAAIHDGSPELFSILRQAIVDDMDGWVDVVPFNNHLCFLKGSDGQFDWVVRDQRNDSLSINPLYPILDAKELPSEQRNTFSVWHYYQTGRSLHDDHLAAWTWQHDRGDLLKGERKPLNMIEQYLRDTGTYRVVARPYAAPVQTVKRPIFYDHRVGSVPLKVSELITAEQLLEFVCAENWLQTRAQRSEKAGIRLDPIEPQIQEKNLPAGVTYYDAIAYCGWLEKQLGAPVRLLTPTEWQSALPTQLKERHVARLQNRLPVDQAVRVMAKRKLNRGKRPTDRVVGCEFDGKLMDHEDLPWLDQARYGAVSVRFVEENVSWVTNDDGLPFLDGRGFGEWLNNMSHGHAPAVCAAYGRTLSDGELHTADHAIYSTYKHHGCKIGFRVCFIQSLDS